MTETPPAPPARSRSRIRLSARGLTILVLVLGAGLAWVIRPARMQRDAVTAIQRLGGEVTNDLSPEELSIGGQSRPSGKNGDAAQLSSTVRLVPVSAPADGA